MRIQTVIVGQIDTNCYVLSEEGAEQAIIIDPGDDPEKIRAYIDAQGLRPVSIVFTHTHYDHVCAAKELKDHYAARLIMHEADDRTYEETKRLCMSWGFDEEDFPPPDLMVRDGDIIRAGGLHLSVMHTPGHTPGSICLRGDTVLFTGDTLFRGSAGRTDLPGGDRDRLLASIRKLMLIEPSTRVLCGHEDETTIAREINTNPFMRAR